MGVWLAEIWHRILGEDTAVGAFLVSTGKQIIGIDAQGRDPGQMDVISAIYFEVIHRWQYLARQVLKDATSV